MWAGIEFQTFRNQAGRTTHVAEGQETYALALEEVGMGTSVFRAFAYFPRNLEAQPNLFLFHGVVIMGVSPLCREAALRAYCAVERSETLRRLALPQRVARTLLSLGTAAFFSVLVLAFSFPFTRLLKLIY